MLEYMDDAIIYIRRMNEYVQHITELLNVFLSKLSHKKCEFGKPFFLCGELEGGMLL